LTKTRYITVGDERVIEYEYDDLYRLVEADYRSTGLTTGSSGEYFAYAHDAVGNRKTYTATITQTTVITYDYPSTSSGQVTTPTGCSTPGAWPIPGTNCVLHDGARNSGSPALCAFHAVLRMRRTSTPIVEPLQLVFLTRL